MSACFLHPHTPAVATCTDCRQPTCVVCTKYINGKPYCEHCAVNHHQHSPIWAGIYSFFVPGLGQAYNGDWVKAVLIFLTGCLVLPWLYGIVDAVLVAQAIARGERPESPLSPGYAVLALKVGFLGLSIAYFSCAWVLLGALLGALGLSLAQP